MLSHVFIVYILCRKFFKKAHKTYRHHKYIINTHQHHFSTRSVPYQLLICHRKHEYHSMVTYRFFIYFFDTCHSIYVLASVNFGSTRGPSVYPKTDVITSYTIENKGYSDTLHARLVKKLYNLFTELQVDRLTEPIV